MAETSEQSGKTLEMRVAELEDKLAQTQITEADLKAYHKVAAALAAQPGATPAVPSTAQAVGQPCIAHAATQIPQVCTINSGGIHHPIVITIRVVACELAQGAAAPVQTDFGKLGS